MGRRMPLWAALSAGVAVFIGCGVFFALQNLGTANDYATLASFFLALLTAAGSLLSFARSKQEPETAPHEEGQGDKPAGGSLIIHGGHIGGIQQGKRNRLEVTFYSSPPDEKPPKKRRRWF